MKSGTSLAAQEIERGITHVQIALPWGTVEWRAATSTIEGRLTDGQPFTIRNAEAVSLVTWLRGVPSHISLRTLTSEERHILEHGHLGSAALYQLPKLEQCHPGETIKEYLDAREWTTHDLAINADLPLPLVNDICDGVKPVTQEVAQKLERVLGRPARLWLQLQSNYDDARLAADQKER